MTTKGWTPAIARRVLWIALAMVGLGAFAPGCWQPTEGAGSFCATPSNGGEFCVTTDYEPEEAWTQAAAHGPEPIQMWATWGSEVTLDEIVRSGKEIRSWFGDISTVTSYVRNHQGGAESYSATLGGRLAELIQQTLDRQEQILAQKPDPIGDFKDALTDAASAEKGTLVAEIAADKQTMADVQAVLDKAKADAAPLSTAYASLVMQFTTYRATEETETTAYVTLSQQASAGSLAALPAVEQAIVTAAQAASSKPNDLTQAAMQLAAQIQVFEMAFQKAIAPHEDFMATHGAAMPDMTSSAMRSINAMLGYAQQRVARSDATAASLLAGIAMRKKALALLAAPPPPPAMNMIAKAKLLQASATFDTAADARVVASSAAPPMSARLELPYLAARYDQLTRLLQMQALCDPSSSSWREAGCSKLRARFGAAAIYLKTTLPALIASGLATMRVRGADTRLIDAARAKLDAGEVKASALAHDAILRSMEGT